MKYDPRYDKKNYFDGVPEDRAAVDNIFRLGVTNQMRLNINADQKAGQMITVSAIVFSVTAANFDNPILMYPLMFFAICCILTLLFAIIAIIPNAKYPKNNLGKLDQISDQFNPLYFGHYSHLTKNEYKAYYALTLLNDDRIYDALAEEIYVSGKALALVKYKWLRWSYGMFLFGMVGSIMITIFSLIVT
jgi:hypothetical protein